MRVETSAGDSGLAALTVPPARLLARPTLRAFRHVVGGYYLTFRRLPNLVRPRLFSEKMQWRKLFDRNPLFAVLSDKIAVRDFVAARVGPGRTPEILWVGDRPEDIPFDRLEPPYAVKCSHRSGMNVLVPDDACLDRDAARAELRAAWREDYGRTHFEPGYVPIVPRLFAERLVVMPDGSPPVEHYVHVFSGRVAVIETAVLEDDGAGGREWRLCFHDRDWRKRNWREMFEPTRRPVARPACLDAMIGLAETLGAGFDYIRVDLYDAAEGLVVSELSLYANSGLMVYEPFDEVERELGALWQIERPLRRALAACFLP
jgi:hypothetical protein